MNLDTATGRGEFLRQFQADLEAAYEVGRGAFPDLPPLPFEAFADHVASCVAHVIEGERASARAAARPRGTTSDLQGGRPAAPLPQPGEVLGRLHVDDLYLAAHCARGTNEAWQTLGRLYGPVLVGYALKLDPTLSSMDAFRDSLLADLCAPAEGSTRPRIATYDGSGRLIGWLASVTYRKVIDRARRRRAEETLKQALVLRLTGVSRDKAPAQIAIKAEWDVFLKEAVPAALQALALRDQALLRLHHFGAVEQKTLARAYGMSEWQLSRHFKRVYRAIRRDLERRAAEAMAARPEELAAVRDLLAGHLARFFEGQAPGPQSTDSSTSYE